MNDRLAIESRDHFVYVHKNAADEIVYVGRTADPDRRPRDPDGREWMKSEQTTVEVFGPFPYEEACEIESNLIEERHPVHNAARGWRDVKRTSELVGLAVKSGMKRRDAQYFESILDGMPDGAERKAQQIRYLRGEEQPPPFAERDHGIFGKPAPTQIGA